MATDTYVKPGNAGTTVSWSDIETMYAALNEVRTKFSLASVSVPASQRGSAATVTPVINLHNAISSTSTLSALRGMADLLFSTAPTQGSTITAGILPSFASAIEFGMAQNAAFFTSTAQRCTSNFFSGTFFSTTASQCASFFTTTASRCTSSFFSGFFTTTASRCTTSFRGNFFIGNFYTSTQMQCSVFNTAFYLTTSSRNVIIGPGGGEIM